MHARPSGAEQLPRTDPDPGSADSDDEGADEYDVTMNVVLVRQLMDEREWTWADLSREMRMSKSTISRVARYETLPGRRFIFALSRIFPGEPELFTEAPERDAA